MTIGRATIKEILQMLGELGSPRRVVIMAVEDTDQLQRELGEEGAHVVREEEKTIGDRPVSVKQYTSGGTVFQVVS